MARRWPRRLKSHETPRNAGLAPMGMCGRLLVRVEKLTDQNCVPLMGQGESRGRTESLNTGGMSNGE
jgi:hypothetical protein